MPLMKHRGWIALSGFTWFFIGAFLLYKGLHLITEATHPGGLSHQAANVFIAVGLGIGFLKGRFVLVKTVRRVVSRILSLPLPIKFKDVYSLGYWILIGSMMALGMIFRFLPLSMEVKGAIDVAIGSALINGALLYFRAARATYGSDSPAQSP